MPLGGAAIAGVVTQIAGTIAGTRDARLRAQFEQNLGLLDFDQKKQLNDALLRANSEESRQK